MLLSKSYIFSFVILILFTLTSCSWVGETAGKAKAGVENAISDTKEGYHKGYEEEKEATI